MAHAHHTTETVQLAIGTHAHIEGPRDYLELSTCLTALLAAVLVASPETEPAMLVAFLAEAKCEGLDDQDVEYMLMTCTLIDDRERDEAA